MTSHISTGATDGAANSFTNKAEFKSSKETQINGHSHPINEKDGEADALLNRIFKILNSNSEDKNISG